jgi:PAS domain S-box-containing protein
MEKRSNITALVIEDDQEMANLLKRIIHNKFSMDVELAYDCATARQKLTDKDYDLITLDYRLPDGAGLDLLDEITGCGRPHPPVIMVTGHGDEETAARSFRSRASGYVVKDAKLPELLLDAVEKALAEISLKRVEKELLEEKVFIEDALNGLPDLFAVVDMEGKFFRWNTKVNEITGYTNAEISKMSIAELFRAEDRQKMLDGMQRLRNEGFAIDEVVLETKSGEHRYYELSGRLLRNYDGIPIGFSGIGRDITDRVLEREELRRYRDELQKLVDEQTAELKDANARLELEVAERTLVEEASRSNASHLQSILENSGEVIAILAADGTILEISPSIEPFLGYGPDSMLGEKVFDFVHPDDIANVFATHNTVAEGTIESNASDCRFKHSDGTWHTLSVSGRIFQGGEGEVRIIVNARDVTESVASQEALRKSEERYRSIFSLSPDFIFLMDREGRFIDANEAMLQRAGITLEELQEINYAPFVTGINDEGLQTTVEKLTAGEAVRGLEVEVRSRRRLEGFFEVNAIPVTEHGEVKSVLGLARDITERKRTEDELKRLNRELEGYAQTVSHDLRSPLTSIKLAADHLSILWQKRESVEDLGAGIERVAEIVRASTGQAEALIEDLLALARAGQEAEEVSLVDVGATVRRVVEEHGPEIAERGVTMKVADDLGKVRANPTHIYQIFSNLIDNGIKHNNSDAPVVEVEYLGDGARGHKYVVRDNGPGIKPEHMDGIFLPFFKGENGYTGIGLTIVDKLVKLYDGEIKVNSNGGACFEFTLRDR